MLTITSPRVARALVAGRLRSRRRAAWGSFAQRSIDRRYCGLLASGSFAALARIQSTLDPFGTVALARIAGGHPSSLVWSW